MGRYPNSKELISTYQCINNAGANPVLPFDPLCADALFFSVFICDCDFVAGHVRLSCASVVYLPASAGRYNKSSTDSINNNMEQ